MGFKNTDQKKKNKSKNKNKIIPNKISEENSYNNHEGSNGGGSMRGKFIADPRFTSMHSDPRFQKVSKHKSKVAIDSRFNRMFTDKRFVSSLAPLDKRGKPRKQQSDSSLRHYYRIEEQEEEEEEEEEEERVEKGNGFGSQEDEEEESGNEKLRKLDRVASGSELSSESGASESDDDEQRDGVESTTDEEDEEMVYEDDMHEVQVENVPVIEEETRRLAVVNMDWRHVRAVDLYVVLRSFLPKGGEMLSVAVYPSEFGLQRMKEEEVKGPVALFVDENEKTQDDGDDDEIDYEKLRAYEKSRLRYYYAVVECDSVATADHLYKACDGIEFERSSNVFDLRFIPDTMEFKHPPRDVAREAPASYEGLDFHTKALQHSDVHISWDEDEPQRVKTLKRKLNADQLAKLDLQEFLASDESETDDDENENNREDLSEKRDKKRDKYLSLIQSSDGSEGEDEEGAQDMEVTFNTGLKDISKHILEKKDKKSETVWEAYLRRKREKKKAGKKKSMPLSEEESGDSDEEGIEGPDDFFVEEPSVKKVSKKDARGKSKKEEKKLSDEDKEAEASRAELELLLADDKGEDNGVKGYNLKPKKVKGKRVKEVVEEDKIPNVDYDDPRFRALFTSPLFQMDPTDPRFKRSAAYARQVAQKKQKGKLQELVEEKPQKPPSKAQLVSSDDPEVNKDERTSSSHLPSNLSSLIKSLKSKCQQGQLPSNEKTSRKNEKLHPRYTEEPDHSISARSSAKKKAKILHK